MVTLLISTPSPFPSLTLSLPPNTPLHSLSYILSPLCPPWQQSLSSATQSVPLDSTAPLSSLSNDGALVTLRLGVRLPGGKGGFASQLRAQGGRMSSNKASNNDSCRDLNGRRLSTIKEATKLAAYIQAAPDREKAEKDKAVAKLEALNLEIARLGGGADGEGASGSKRRLDDSAFVEESREIVEGVRDAVKEAMLKKRKKNKAASTTPSSSSAPSTSTSAPVASSSSLKHLPAVVESQSEEVTAGDVVQSEGGEEQAEVEEVEKEQEEEEEEKKPKGRAAKGKGRAKK